jgi:putative phosphoribosyl transferase
VLTQPLFRDRIEAGWILGKHVKAAVREPHPVVLALPRGGVPVGFEVAKALHADLDIFLVRKLGVPGHEELAMGAIASGGVRVLNEELVRDLRVPSRLIEIIAAKEQQELLRRELLYREGRPPIPLSGRTAILVDDGLATRLRCSLLLAPSVSRSRGASWLRSRLLRRMPARIFRRTWMR